MDTSWCGKVDMPASEFYEVFRKYDKDGNGFIEKGELDTFLEDLTKSTKSDVSTKDIQEAKIYYLGLVDDNKDARLEPAELAKILVPKENFLLNYVHVNKIESVDFIKIWNNYDNDKSGFLESNELVGFLGDLLQSDGKTVTMMKLDDFKDVMMDLFDVNKDGRISMIEFEKILPIEDNFLKKFAIGDLTKERVNEIIAHYDKDKSGFLERAEMTAFVRDLWKATDSDTDPPANYVDNICLFLGVGEDGKVSTGQLIPLLIG